MVDSNFTCSVIWESCSLEFVHKIMWWHRRGIYSEFWAMCSLTFHLSPSKIFKPSLDFSLKPKTAASKNLQLSNFDLNYMNDQFPSRIQIKTPRNVTHSQSPILTMNIFSQVWFSFPFLCFIFQWFFTSSG